MTTDKKNQHYIPKLYLRNFSFHNNKKQIGVYNLNNKIFIQNATLKDQGCKNFFYGYDGVIEDKLSNIEGVLSKAINQVIEKNEVPKKNSENHSVLLVFITLTDLRNPVNVNWMKRSLCELKERLLELDQNANIDNLVPNPSHDEIVRTLLSQTEELCRICFDLDFKLLINKTRNPFITSDFPIIKYNQFLENAKWQYSKSGYASVGLQIIIPLNSELALFFFDSGIYKVGDKKKKYLEINSVEEVDSINILQFINCIETIYFDEKASENYIRQLANKSKKYIRANEIKSELCYLVRKSESQTEIFNGKKNLIHFNAVDCECKLKINGVKIHSNGHAYKFNNSVTQFRPHVDI